MNHKILLPAEIQKDIIVYLNYAIPLFIKKSSSTYDDILINNFFNIYSTRTSSNFLWLDFLESKSYGGLFDEKYLCHDELNELNDVFDYMYETLMKNNYLVLVVDPYYIKKCCYYKNSHLPLQLLVRGIDMNNNVIDVIYANNNNNFLKQEVSFSCIHNGLFNMCDEVRLRYSWIDKKRIVELHSKNNFVKTKQVIISDIRSYINSDDCIKKIRPEIIHDYIDRYMFGFNACTGFIDELNLLLNDIFTIDYRFIHLLYEHKKLMYIRLNYLFSNENSLLLEKYNNVVLLYNKASNLFKKNTLIDSGLVTIYGQLKNKTIIAKIIELLNEANKKEFEVLSLI